MKMKLNKPLKSISQTSQICAETVVSPILISLIRKESPPLLVESECAGEDGFCENSLFPLYDCSSELFPT